MINLITSFFIPKEVERQNEILKCLKNNINSRYIKKIYLCIEKKEDLDFLKEKIPEIILQYSWQDCSNKTWKQVRELA